ncbi:flagellar biosynthetic protein FliR [Tamilnaduibacter salinus]|uniref:Flagellar biosynthetic protein FliR n=1 Tax=Tamilnaduibacter salinus TaxID=1484056 RepID=A0A2A2I7R5_9GAMM|nr:flagellar biosynthetic protein FliR [Tamilnaduibacter salinus]PAV27366.1 flagellar biosynthetic protein FliR [Tamilnaduibacter salinus]PVY79261.1 flagellar biosynthetic protein FliR [Tamilnaduibacter salinus]
MEPIAFSTDVIGQWVGQHLWPLFRIGSFMMAIPFIGTNLVPARVRLGLALLMTFLVAPLIGDVPRVDALSADAVVITLQQVLIGAGLGFALTALFQLFVIGGQMIAMQMGLGFASAVDPSNGVSVPVLSQIYSITVTLLFLAMNGHLVAFEIIVESFNMLPIGTTGLASETYWQLAHRISWMFVSAMLLALPAVSAVFIVNISFGVMTRAAPQMNIFSLGFPIGLIFGLFAIWVLHANFLPHFEDYTRQTFAFMRDMLAAAP